MQIYEMMSLREQYQSLKQSIRSNDLEKAVQIAIEMKDMLTLLIPGHCCIGYLDSLYEILTIKPVDMYKADILAQKIKYNLYHDIYFEDSTPLYELISASACKNNIVSRDLLTEGLPYYILKNVRIKSYGDMSFIYNMEMQILTQSMNYPDKLLQHYPSGILESPNPDYVKLDYICNLALTWNYNFWHFFYEALPIVLSMEDAGFDGKYLVCNKTYIFELMSLIGISSERIIPLLPQKIYIPHRLYVPESCAYSSHCLDAWIDRAVTLIRQQIPQVKDTPRKLYVKRIDKRKIKNNDEIEALLVQKGFKTMIPEEHSVIEQAMFFSNSDVVFCPHGANSTNAVFMKPGSLLIESFGHKYIWPYMNYELAKRGIRYQMIVENVNQDAVNINEVSKYYFYDGVYDDYILDVDIVKIILDNT